MSLRNKLLLSMVLLALVPLLLFGLTAYAASTASLINVERDNLAGTLNSVGLAMTDLQKSVGRSTQDYSNWDDLWNAVSADGPINPEFIKINFDPASAGSATTTFGLQVVTFWNKDLQVKYNLGPIDEVQKRVTAIRDSLLQGDQPVTDYIVIGNDIYIVSFKAIRKSDATEPNGFMVFGRMLGDADVQQLKALTGYDVALYNGQSSVATSNSSLDVTPAPEALRSAATGQQVLDQSNSNIALAYGPLKDMAGNTVATLVVWRPRTAAVAAQSSITTTLAGAFVFGALLATIVSLLVQRSITQPLLAMADTADKIAAGDLNQRVSAPSRDELGRLANAFNQMTAKVSERFSESTNENMRLQQMNEYRLNLLRAITQELQAPVHSIKGYTESLSMAMYGTLNEAQKRLVEAIGRSVALEDALISDLVDFSSAQQKQLRISRERVVIDQVVRDTVQNVKQRYSNKSIQFTPSIPADLPPVFADQARLSQIMEHLLTWSYDVTVPNGRVLLSAVPAHGMVKVSISDTSKGLDPDEAEHVFDLFYHANSTGDGNGNGHGDGQNGNRRASISGLGLAMVKALVEQHGGTLDVRVKSGEGNTFTFTLPSTN